MARQLAGRSYALAYAIGLYRPVTPPVAFVAENANWSTRWDGTYITEGVNALAPGTATLTSRPEQLFDCLVHFGSQYMWDVWADALSASNRYVVTYFHGKPEDGPDAARHVDRFLASLGRLSKVVTAASLMESRLLDWGVPRDKLVRIPIGVDTALFTPPSTEQRRAARDAYSIPADHVCIGSFQKDGVGWGDGAEPKLIKGPDVFLDVVAKLREQEKVFVLLTGPARGYVKRGLDKLGVSYAHRFVEDYRDLVSCYHAIDLYLVTSREEGGPKAIMESMAAGVPLVSTRVGMAPDIIHDGVNGGMTESEDVAGLFERSLAVIRDPDHRAGLIAAGRDSVADYDWRHVAAAHYERVYKPLLP
jgi:glycosyltransferase involved in cell wall biosynthesis